MGSSSSILIHLQGRFFSKAILFFGLVIVSVPVILSFFEINWPLVLIPLGALLFIPSQQFEVDNVQMRCRDCTNFLGFKMGEWRSLKDVKYLTLNLRTYTFLRESGLMAMDSKEEDEYNFVLHFHKNDKQKIEIDEFDSKQECLTLGLNIAKHTGLRLLDVSSKPPEFIE